VTFRFYGPLNDFLTPPQRQRRFTHVVPGPVSVKDAIEGLGVPHPEADVVLVNGESRDFGYRLADGDDIAVYPRFRSLDVGGLPRAGGDPPEPVRFVLDVHLRKLSALLRLCGFDAILLEEDADVAAASARDQRVALTRDVGLLKRSIIRHGYWVRHTDPELQLAEVLERFDLRDWMAPFSRCLECNTPVVLVDAGAVADRLLPHTRERFQEFRQCAGCGRIYWQGSHYDRLAALIQRARERIADSTEGPYGPT
jgi:uncharacterized protein with PIN domain